MKKIILTINAIALTINVIPFLVKEYFYLKDFYCSDSAMFSNYLEYLKMCKKNEWQDFVNDYLLAVSEIFAYKIKELYIKP